MQASCVILNVEILAKRVIIALLSCSLLGAQRLSDFTTTHTPLPAGATLVIGFLGGFESWNDEHRSVRQLVLKLRDRPGVYAESIANRRRKVAMTLIRRARPARIILFGQSWGGAAVVDTARDLQRRGIPVLLTIQVDSVGRHDAVIPANVRKAVNFYQHDPLTIQGRREIRAADPSKTQILGNFKFSYPPGIEENPNASLARRTLGGSHAKMELDPAVWNQVEQYISGALAGRD